ncbi:hypothetical protein [Roseospira goensis]|uniref:Uncharacterized protein n=1 Tax=Roseospira goensis TaxID=391922 RepID=A0A7W6RZT1_9PROT|nr:hypothetical protein [Roseospira goensis]MBB4286248.1 hypothetical protein [Roseospira goensis]
MPGSLPARSGSATVALALAVAMGATGTVTPAAAGGDVGAALAWAERFYAGGPFCSTAVVAAVTPAPPSVRVRLDIDPRWARDLAGMDPALRDGWFALHCPFVLEPVWTLLPLGGDVIIEGGVPGLGTVRYGCRADARRWSGG